MDITGCEGRLVLVADKEIGAFDSQLLFHFQKLIQKVFESVDPEVDQSLLRSLAQNLDGKLSPVHVRLFDLECFRDTQSRSGDQGEEGEISEKRMDLCLQPFIRVGAGIGDLFHLTVFIFDALNEQINLFFGGYGDDFPCCLVLFDFRQGASWDNPFVDQIIEEGFQHGESVRDGDVGVPALLQMEDELCDTALVSDVEILLGEKPEEDTEGNAVTHFCFR